MDDAADKQQGLVSMDTEGPVATETALQAVPLAGEDASDAPQMSSAARPTQPSNQPARETATHADAEWGALLNLLTSFDPQQRAAFLQHVGPVLQTVGGGYSAQQGQCGQGGRECLRGGNLAAPSRTSLPTTWLPTVS